MIARRPETKLKFLLPIAAVLLALVLGAACLPEKQTTAVPPREPTAGETLVNINTADEAELAGLPFIGPKMAAQIVGHRNAHGPFRRPEHLMLIPGISEKRFRSIRHLITVE